MQTHGVISEMPATKCSWAASFASRSELKVRTLMAKELLTRSSGIVERPIVTVQPELFKLNSAPRSIIWNNDKMGFEIVGPKRMVAFSKLHVPPVVAATIGTRAAPTKGMGRFWASRISGPSSAICGQLPAKEIGAQCVSLALSTAIKCSL